MAIGNSIYKKKPNYTVDKNNKWSDELEGLYNQISNREQFSYDMNNDAFYKQYAQRYTDNARLAMEDTVAQASALTGGYGNSYAATAGQAMYNQQMEGLNDKATELYQLALQRYNAEGDRLNNLYSVAANNYSMEQDRINADVAEAQWNAEFDEMKRQYEANMAYQASRDAVADAQWAAGHALDVRQQASADAQWRASMAYNAKRDAAEDAQWEKTFEYNASRDAVDDSRWEREFEYQKQRDAVSDNQFAQEMAYKYANMNKQKQTKAKDDKEMLEELEAGLEYQRGYKNQKLANENMEGLINYYYENEFITEETANKLIKKWLK